MIYIVSVLILIFLLIAFMFLYSDVYYDEDEVVTTVTTTTTTVVDEAHVAPNPGYKQFLTRSADNGGWYVFDPIDGEKVYLRETDDMYEDAVGGIWNLK